jgi:uncharacterized coiled-coil DUF342 family protein
MKKETKKNNVVQVEITPEIRALFDGYHKETEQEMKRHVGALSEDFQHGLSAVAEQFSGLNEKIDVLGNEMKEVKAKLDMNTEMIGVLMETTEEIKDELKNKADKTETIRLAGRVSVLEHTS